jgi:hypothetical protein
MISDIKILGNINCKYILWSVRDFYTSSKREQQQKSHKVQEVRRGTSDLSHNTVKLLYNGR